MSKSLVLLPYKWNMCIMFHHVCMYLYVFCKTHTEADRFQISRSMSCTVIIHIFLFTRQFVISRIQSCFFSSYNQYNTASRWQTFFSELLQMNIVSNRNGFYLKSKYLFHPSWILHLPFGFVFQETGLHSQCCSSVGH